MLIIGGINFNQYQMKNWIKIIVYFCFEILLTPFSFLASIGFKYMKIKGFDNFPITRNFLNSIEIGIIRNHYYDPVFLKSQIESNYDLPRELIGIEWNISGQLNFLSKFKFETELDDLPLKFENTKMFYLQNPAFSSGDADYWYQIIRTIKPKTIIEIGSGHSSLLAQKAISMNIQNNSHSTHHICIEPYEKKWLNELNIELYRKRVEEMPLTLFEKLKSNDILFIDSSHIIRPQGDLLFEIQYILPRLKSGVIVHFHDIFSPYHYPLDWIVDDQRLWNEQYLLEAFLTNNNEWEIIGALNYLKHFHFKEFKDKCPLVTKDRKPGSFYIQKK